MYYDIDQRSDEWFTLKRGVPTSSSFNKIVTSKGAPSKQVKDYMYRLAGEEACKYSEKSYQSDAMLRGCELEEEARQIYTLKTGRIARNGGFFISEEVKAGASPDGLIGEDGLLEIKCPSMSVHVSYLVKNKLPTEYFQQVQGQLFVTGRKYCDFESYYPGLRPLLVRVERDELFISLLKDELIKCCKSVSEIVDKIT